MKKTAMTFYDMLGLSPLATDEDVRRAYRALALRWHPDRNPQNLAVANHYTALLNRAYAHLRTAPQRRAYDRYLLLKTQPQTRPSLPATQAAAVSKKEPGRTERKPTMLTLMKEIFWPLAPAPQEMRHG